MSPATSFGLSEAAACVFAPRPDDHKYRRGLVELRTGSLAYPGAAVLGAEAAARGGAGFVRYAGPHAVASRVLDRRPETVCASGGHDADVVVAGSGVEDPGDPRLVDAVRRARGGSATVLDATALQAVPTEDPAVPGAVLTPHAGELAQLATRLVGRRIRVRDVEGDPEGIAAEVARATGAVVVAKGHRTIVASPDTLAVVVAPTSWLAVAGTGDVLAGLVGALGATAAHRDPVPPLAELAAAAAWLHGRAGALAAARVLDPAAPADDVLDDVSRAHRPVGGPVTALDVADALSGVIAAVLAR
ncbi:NAD(P)H-hydrate dehydratase [Pseudoclavibacter chungangensis]|uniref:ADP-dependent (S)-NAD(P)H-hydrate dehydratase n=1 Tax=Pseudoclavibacter chungangensis TaxID=587635 RepID=A0A7J5BPH0_9MICO|nr:NAD(P)H-hydrate dehydratase [Pseudoclavibacter chungangensis]KAB1655060.1 NAD(P)H-hydrate dehydratase [Pseudoclavibacter chungangensis]NYJ66177.1 hydroxyethylthiazole kinase-like uncharacterized protein yjeF [Pseudoclavibacter chungangensis]